MSQSRLPFEIDQEVDESLVTAHAGVPLLVELFRATGGDAVCDAKCSSKRRQRGLKASEMLESLLALWTAGGERCEDLAMLREDRALSELIGHEFPAPQTARDFLEGFHQDDLPLWQQGEHSSVPSESLPLLGLEQVNGAVVNYVQHQHPATEATLDVDATIVECDKRAARTTYEGTHGYQPVLVLWAEQDQLVGNEFRDGNVPAGSGNRRVLERAVGSLPQEIKQIRVRGDSALYEQDLLRWLDSRSIEYAISADMSRELSAAVAALPESAWQLDKKERDATRQWAEVVFTPTDDKSRKDAAAPRYLAIRIVKRQSSFFADGTDRRHFAVVTNRQGDGLDVLRWHRLKAGTIEHAHDILKRDLAAAALPSQKFGANAAWFRMNVILYNLLSAMRTVALPEDFRRARPKRMRFALFNTVGRVVSHARERLLRLACEALRSLADAVRLKIPPRTQVLPGV
ncbi:MAG: IS1380 family transposase [Elusimicrobiota bacterium]